MNEVLSNFHVRSPGERASRHSPGHFGSSMENSGPSWHGEGDVVSSEGGDVSIKLESGEHPWTPPSGRAGADGRATRLSS